MAKQDELVFLPLGGSGEIGMNLNLFGIGKPGKYKWLMVDLGVTFGDLTTPGVEIIMPDTKFIEEKKDDLLGIVLTHAHEDHMGAVARLWPRLRCPVWATPFTKYLLDDRLEEAGLLDDVPVHEIPLQGSMKIGPFDCEFLTLTHSIPEPNGLMIRTALGNILHTGDWKIDDNPQIGEPIDKAEMRKLGEEGVLALICDSTNVLSDGYAGSEADVRRELTKLIAEQKGKKVAVASFASNVARLETVFMAAKETGRAVCLVGRSMHRMVGAAKAVGLLKGIGDILDIDEADAIPDAHILYLCTGSQGESRAALSRIADDQYRGVHFGKGDVIIFSSKVIPGNEKSIFYLQNRLAAKGVKIFTEKDRPIHVSGHPKKQDLKDFYSWARPTISIPVHGERRHLIEHAELALELQVPFAIAPYNGDVIKLSQDGPEIVDQVETGRLYEDGAHIISEHDDAMRLRRKMAYAGHVAVSLVVDSRGDIVAGPDTRISGFPDGENGALMEEMIEEVGDVAEAAFDRLKKSSRRDEDKIEEAVARAVRRFVRDTTNKRSVIEVTAFVL